MVSKYTAYDMMMGNKMITINILNNKYASDKLIDEYVNEFIDYPSINCSGILKSEIFDLISVVDGKRVKEKNYFYTCEFFESNSDIFKLTKNMNNEEILHIFIDICKSVEYLHIRGLTFGALYPDNILVNVNKHNYRIKLKDIATIKLEEKNWDTEGKLLEYYAPEVLAEGETTVLSDIYSLGMLLFMLYYRNSPDKFTIYDTGSYESERQAFKFKLNCDDDFICKVCSVIEKMLDPVPGKRYKRVYDIAADINVLFKTNFRIHDLNELEILDFNIKICGRDYEINSVLKDYETIKMYGAGGKFIIVHGGSGIGKTRFLREIMYRLYMRKANVYGSLSTDDTAGKPYINLLKKIIASTSDDIIDRYRTELSVLIPELNVHKDLNVYNYNIQRDKFRIMNKIYNFIAEITEDSPMVIIVDDAHLSDNFYVEFLELLYTHISSSNILCIISYRDGEAAINKKFHSFISKIRNKQHVTDMAIRELTAEDTGLMVKSILRLWYIPVRFSARIFSVSYGNPLFIQEIIRNLYLKKHLYINENYGCWDTENNGDYDNLIMPESLELIVANQLKNLKDKDCDILNVISIFNSAISSDVIKGFFEKPQFDIQKSVDELVSGGFLARKIGDFGYVFDFNNKFLKSIIYGRIPEDIKMRMHKKASELLEKNYENGADNSEELIYHFEKSHNSEMVIKYCLQNADKMESLRNKNDAIKSLKRAIDAFPKESKDTRKVQIMLRIGSNYSDEGDRISCIEYCKKAERLAAGTDDKKLSIDCLNKIAFEYYSMNELDKAESYLDKVFHMLKGFDYNEGYVRALTTRARIYLNKRDYDNAQESIEEAIEKCPMDNYELMGYLNNMMGILFARSSKYDAALQYFEKSYKYNKKGNVIKGIIDNLNNIGGIYSEHYKDDYKAKEYFYKMRELCQIYGFVHEEALALSNTALMCYYKLEYDEAQKLSEESVSKAPEGYYDVQTFFAYNVLFRVSLKTGDFKRAWECYGYSQKALRASPDQGREISVYYMACAELFYESGSLEKAESFAKDALGIIGETQIKDMIDCRILYELISISIKGGRECQENIDNIVGLSNLYIDYANRTDAICDLCILLLRYGLCDDAEKLIRPEIDRKPVRNDRTEVKRLCVAGMVDKGYRRLKTLEDSIIMARKLKDRKLLWRMCCEVGDIYYGKKNFFYAVNYYFEACEVIKDIVMQLPEEYRIRYIESHGCIMAFNKLKRFIDTNGEDRGYSIKDKEDLEHILSYNDFLSIINNRNFIKSANRIYSKSMPQRVHTIKDVIMNITNDEIKSLELIIKYISACALATRGLIIVERQDESRECIVSNTEDMTLPRNIYILDRAKMTRKPVLYNTIRMDNGISSHNILNDGVKAAICVPVIYNEGEIYDAYEGKRLSSANTASKTKAYIYLESERILNNFTEHTVKTCTSLSSLIGVLIDKHEINIGLSIDKLTGTYTRRYIEDSLAVQIENAQSAGHVFSILMFDLDHFKIINDKFGHQTGDRVLKKLCHIVMSNLDGCEPCGRYGGEEFIVILPGMDSSDAYKKAEEIRCSIEYQKILGDKHAVTVSIGISTYPINGQTPQELIEKADQALYMAKNSGRNRCCMWDSHLTNNTRAASKLTGIITGNAVQDQRNVEVMSEMIELIKGNIPFDKKIYSALGRIIEITEAQEGIIYVKNDDGDTKSYGRKAFSEDWADVKNINRKVIEDVLEKGQGVYMIDWDGIPILDPATGIPDWHSVIAVPLINSGKVKGILYLTASTRQKEFKFNDYNFVNTLAGLIAAML